MSALPSTSIPLKRLASVRPSNVDKHSVVGETGVRLCNYVDVYKNERITNALDFMEATASDAQLERFGLQAGDVLITKDSEEPTDIGVPAFVPSTLPGVVCGYHLALLRPESARLSGRYLYWALQTFNAHAYFSTAATGITRYALSVNDIEMVRIPLPSLTVQERIANYLDEKTARIDALIAEKERLVAFLDRQVIEMVDQAVLGHGLERHGEYLKDLSMLGKLPADWGISRLKFEVEYVTSGSRGWADYYSGDGALFVRIGNLTRNSIDLDWTDVQHVRLPDGVEGVRARVRPGDLLISITAYLGSVAVAPADIDETYVSQHVALARPHCERSTAEWLGYAVLSSVGRTYFELQAYGGTKIQLSLDDIREMPVPVPPLAVQRRRLSLLKTQLQQLSDLSTHAMTHIERLREYRASLITASVTGQLAHVA